MIDKYQVIMIIISSQAGKSTLLKYKHKINDFK